LYLKRIQLENVRGFEDLDLDLERPNGNFAGWTVFAGANGSGKTTLLQSIARAIYGDELGRIPPEDFLRKGKSQCLARMEFVPGSEDADAPPKEQSNSFAYGFSRDGRSRTQVSPYENTLTEYEKGWLVLGYGPFRRLTGEKLDRKMTPGERRVRTLFSEGAALSDAIFWLQRVNYKSLESDSPEAIPANKLQRIAMDLINDDLLPNGVTLERVSSKGLHLKSNDLELTLDQFSDGYRSVIAMVLDILQHIVDAFGEVDCKSKSKPLQVKNEGIILIDEIDAHLHVSWQKKIGFWLKSHFPNIQFLVTSHSPFVCQAADENGLIRLPAPGDPKPAHHLSEDDFYTVVNGSSDEATLSTLFGLEYTHSSNAEALHQELANIEGRMIEEEEISPEDITRRNKLIQMLPKDGANEVGRLIRSYQGS
jgi:energy-coupling factor transporter ATP-binding protein EcfA2